MEQGACTLTSPVELPWPETVAYTALHEAYGETRVVWPCGVSQLVMPGEGHPNRFASERPCVTRYRTQASVDQLQRLSYGSDAGRDGLDTPAMSQLSREYHGCRTYAWARACDFLGCQELLHPATSSLSAYLRLELMYVSKQQSAATERANESISHAQGSLDA